MDEYIEYQIINGEFENDCDTSGASCGGCLMLILIFVVVIWLIGKLFGF